MYNKHMSSKAKAGRQACKRLAHNNKQWVIISRAKNGDCTYCPPNGGENLRGHHSRWGRKRAIKRWYVTGKGRNSFCDRVNRLPNFSYGDNGLYDKGIQEGLYTVNPKKGRPCFCL